MGPCKSAKSFRTLQMSNLTDIEIIVLTHSLLTFVSVKSPSYEESIFFKIRSFFFLQIFSGPQLINYNYPDSQFHGHWKTVTLSSISPNLSKHWRFNSVLAEFVLWEFSFVSSLSWYSSLVQHARNDRAWLTSKCTITTWQLLRSPKLLCYIVLLLYIVKKYTYIL